MKYFNQSDLIDKHERVTKLSSLRDPLVSGGQTLGGIDHAFILFRDLMGKEGYIVCEGNILVATLIKYPVHRNSRDKNDQIMSGETPQEWSEEKRRQKDVDVVWTTKHGKHQYSSKNNTKVDAKSKLIDEFEPTPANVHNSQVREELRDETESGHLFWTDRTYSSDEIRPIIRENKIGCKIHKNDLGI